MENDNIYGEYRENSAKVKWLRPAILIGGVSLIVLIIVLLTSCGKINIEQDLIQSTEKYLINNTGPSATGECITITVNDLINTKSTSKKRGYNKCSKAETYVKVCKMPSGKNHYTPVIKCGSVEDTMFGEFVDGTEMDLVPNKSDVEVMFKPEMFDTTGGLFYPNDLKEAKDVKEYYLKSPADKYIYQYRSSTDAYKWYKEETGDTYWNNGEFTSSQPIGFDKKGIEGTPIVKIVEVQPVKADYRTIESVKIYRTSTIIVAHPYRYTCYDDKLSGTITTPVKCEERNATTHKLTKSIAYSCNGTTVVPKDTVCSNGVPTAWSQTRCTSTATTKCEEKNGYKYTDRIWKWYNTGKYKKYYPSNNTDVEKEITYYTEAPSAVYVKDESTKAKAYKYIKQEEVTETVPTND